MRWSYKTVHYDYKKEGLLGGTFLDEVEIEQSMNEFGLAGWELVSLLEVHDGLVAIFKQPLDLPVKQSTRPAHEADRDQRTITVERIPQPEGAVVSSRGEVSAETDVPVSAPQTFRPAPMKVENKHSVVEEDSNGGVGSIRIE
jgi:hypothetical protein